MKLAGIVGALAPFLLFAAKSLGRQVPIQAPWPEAPEVVFNTVETDPWTRKTTSKTVVNPPKKLPEWLRWWYWDVLSEACPRRELGKGPNVERYREKARFFLLGLLKHQYDDVRAAAALSLAKMEAPGAAKEIRPLVKDKVSYVRGIACLSLGILDDKESKTTIRSIASAPNTADFEKATALLGLSMYGDETDMAALAYLTGNKNVDKEVRCAGIIGLSFFGDAVDPGEFASIILDGADRDLVRALAVSCLVRLRPETVEVGKKKAYSLASFLVFSLRASSPGSGLRKAVLQGLGRLGSWSQEGIAKAVPALRKVLGGEPEVYTRGLALRALMRASADSEKERKRTFAMNRKVIRSGGTSDLFAVANIAAALEKDMEALPYIRARIRDIGKGSFGSAVILALGMFGDKESLSLIETMVGKTSSDLAKAACCVAAAMIGRAGKEGGYDVALKGLEALDSTQHCAAAAFALGRVGEPKHLEALIAAGERDLGGSLAPYGILTMALAMGDLRDPCAFDALKNIFTRFEEKKTGRGDIVMTVCIAAIGNLFETPRFAPLREMKRGTPFLFHRYPALLELFRMP